MRIKIKKVIMGLGFLLTVTSIAFSQAGTDSGIKKTGIHMGFSYINLEDKALNNAMHKGTGFSGGWYLELLNNRSVRVFDLVLGSGFLKSYFENETATYRFSGSARYRWLRNISGTPKDLNIYLGGRGEFKTAIEYFDNWDESHFYWLTSYSLGIDFRFNYSFASSNTIMIEGDMPVFSFVSRPPADFHYTQSSSALRDVLKDLNYNLGFLLPGKYIDINFRVKYSFRNSKRLMPALYWKINYQSIEKNGSDNMKYLDQTIGVEYIF